MRQIQMKATLGSGSFGTVYKAELLGGQGVRRTVAVKVLAQSHAGREMFLSRIRDEARLLGLLEDDYILKVLELLRIEGRDAVMMELVEGVDMSTLIEQGMYMPPRALASIGAVLAGALHKAHVAIHPTTGRPLGVVHRDVKPANVMLTTRGGVKLLDFGVAKAAFESRESYTGQLVLGTLNYMAPEYLITGALTPAVDIYGLALLMVEAACGKGFGQPKLLQADFERRREKYLAQLSPEYAPLIDTLRRMMDWDPAARPTGDKVEIALLDIADELTGMGLPRWCGDAVPRALNNRATVRDGEGLCGQTVSIDDEELFNEGTPSAGVDLTTPALEPTTHMRTSKAVDRDAPVRASWSPGAPSASGGGPTQTPPAVSPRSSGATESRQASAQNPTLAPTTEASPKAAQRTSPGPNNSIVQGLILGGIIGGVVVILMLVILAIVR